MLDVYLNTLKFRDHEVQVNSGILVAFNSIGNSLESWPLAGCN